MSDAAVKTLAVNGFDMAYVEAGRGDPLVLIHGSLSDYRYWTLQMKAFAASFRTIAVSLRHYHPERWDGRGDDFNIPTHVADMAAFLQGMGIAPAHIVGHSRGGHVAFRLAQRHPALVRRLVLSEPGGAVSPDMSAQAAEINRRFAPGSFQSQAVERIRAGDVDGGLRIFLDAVSGQGAWDRTPALAQQFTRDNAMTLLGQIREEREPFSRDAAQAIRAETLLVLGELSPPMFGQIVEALLCYIPNSRHVVIPGATHTMNVAKPALYNEAVLDFLQGE